jgi:anti-sigma regulatory factor (Ser/Thr protein kinase)
VVTNAVRHAHTRRVGLRLVRAGALVCEVTDDDHAVPVLLSAGPDDEGGRGMRIVSRLAREWGTSRSAQGKSVWFEQTLPRRKR